jgi:hypothetical protein
MSRNVYVPVIISQEWLLKSSNLREKGLRKVIYTYPSPASLRLCRLLYVIKLAALLNFKKNSIILCGGKVIPDFMTEIICSWRNAYEQTRLR